MTTTNKALKRFDENNLNYFQKELQKLLIAAKNNDLETCSDIAGGLKEDFANLENWFDLDLEN